MISIQNILNFLSFFLSSLIAGLFFAYSCSVNLGLKSLTDNEDIKDYLHNIANAQTNGQKNIKDIIEIILPNAQHNLCIFPDKKDKFFWWYLSRGYEDLITGWIKYRFKN
jgi:hypothetical protein